MTTKTQRKISALSFLLCSFLAFWEMPNGIAQSTANIKQSISYGQTISTTYEIALADRARLYEFEKASLRATNETRNVKMALDQNNDLTTTINITSSNASEPWMTPPAKIIIDKNGVKMYNTQNAVLTDDPYTPEQRQGYLIRKNDLAQNGLRGLPQFQAVNQSHINALQQQGYNVQTLEGGIVQARKGNIEIRYNSAAMSQEVKEYEGTKVVSHTAYKYKNEGGRTVPETKTERIYQTTQSGVCIAHVTHTIFSNYQPVGLP